MSLDHKLRNLLNENEQPAPNTNGEGGFLTPDRLKEFEFSSAERDFWNKKHYEDDLKKIDFILQNQHKVPERVVFFSQDQLEDMKSNELASVFHDIHSNLGLEMPPIEEKKEFLDNRIDQINFILKNEKDLIEPSHWFKNIINFHDIGDTEVERLYKRMMQMLNLTAKANESALKESDELDEKHVKNRKQKIHYILQQQSRVFTDPKDTFSDEDLAMFSDKYIDKLHHKIEKTFLTKMGISEEVDWSEVDKAMKKADYMQVALLFDTTTKLGAEQIVDELLKKGYTPSDVKEVVREIFGGQEIPDYFEDKLSQPPSSQHLDVNPSLNEDGTTADMAVPTLPAFGVAKKKPEVWGESIEDNLEVQIYEIDKVTGSDEWSSTVKDLKTSGWDLDVNDIETLKNGGTVKLYSPNGRRVLNIKKKDTVKEAGAMGATLSQTDLTPDPTKLNTESGPTDTMYESVDKIDWSALEKVYPDYVNEAIDKNMGDFCSDPTHKHIKHELSKYANPLFVSKVLDLFESKQLKQGGEWEFSNFKKHISECLNEKKSTGSDNKGKELGEKTIFKNNEAENAHQTILTEKSMANESRYPVKDTDIQLLENAAAPHSFKILAVRGALVESGREDKLEIAVEKNGTQALVEYFDNDAKPFIVEGKKFMTFQNALGFISENADRFTTEETETTFNEEAKARALKESKDLEAYTKNSFDNYNKERAKYDGKAEDLLKKLLTPEQLKRGFRS